MLSDRIEYREIKDTINTIRRDFDGKHGMEAGKLVLDIACSLVNNLGLTPEQAEATILAGLKQFTINVAKSRARENN